MTRGSALTWSMRAFGQHRAFVQHRHLDAERARRPCRARPRRRWGLVDLAQQFGGLRSRRRSCRRPARRPAAAWGPAPAACRSRAIASGRATAPASGARDRSGGWFQDALDPLALLALGRRRRTACGRAVARQRQQQIVLDGVVLEHRRLLEFAADAELAISVSSSLVRSVTPSNRRRRSSGRVLPVMTSIIVVLPAPLGPMMARISPGSSVSDRRSAP
jgi:hypothetical protein